MKLKNLKNKQLLKMAYKDELKGVDLKNFVNSHNLKDSEELDKRYKHFVEKSVVYGMQLGGVGLALLGAVGLIASVMSNTTECMIASLASLSLGAMMIPCGFFEECGAKQSYDGAKSHLVYEIKRSEIIEK